MSVSGWLLFLVLLISLNGAGRAQDVPLDNCKQLPMVKTTVSKRQFQFLVDTGSEYWDRGRVAVISRSTAQKICPILPMFASSYWRERSTALAPGPPLTTAGNSNRIRTTTAGRRPPY